jgi:glucose uptake protein GlcU
MKPAAFGGPAIGPVPIEFILFAFVLLGVAMFHGWHVAVAYVIGFFVMLAMIGLHPGSAPRASAGAPTVVTHDAR